MFNEKFVSKSPDLILGHGGDKIRRKYTQAIAFVLCALFMVIPSVGAAESTNTEKTVVTHASTDQDLKIGMTGDNVTKLQKWLDNQGFYKGKIDGEFGNSTQQAVKAFQQYVGIKDDGIVGSITRESMDDLVNGNIQAVGSTSYSKTGGSSSNSYSNTYRGSGSGWGYGKGVGDCWENSYALYNQLTASGYQVRIVQYRNSYVSNHRSVQVYKNGHWVDYDYRGNGYSNRYYAQSHKPGMKVIK